MINNKTTKAVLGSVMAVSLFAAVPQAFAASGSTEKAAFCKCRALPFHVTIRQE